MLKNIFKSVGSVLIRRWLAGRTAIHIPPTNAPLIRPNLPLLRQIATRYALLGVALLLHILLFVSGIVVTLVAAAQTADAGGFHTNFLFWTGIGLMFYSLLASGFVLQALRSFHFSTEDLLVVEARPEPASLDLLERFVQPVLAGVIEGFTARRVS